MRCSAIALQLLFVATLFGAPPKVALIFGDAKDEKKISEVVSRTEERTRLFLVERGFQVVDTIAEIPEEAIVVIYLSELGDINRKNLQDYFARFVDKKPHLLVLVLQVFQTQELTLADLAPPNFPLLILHSVRAPGDANDELASRLLQELEKSNVEQALRQTAAAFSASPGFITAPTVTALAPLDRLQLNLSLARIAAEENKARAESLFESIKRRSDVAERRMLAKRFERLYPDHPNSKELARLTSDATPPAQVFPGTSDATIRSWKPEELRRRLDALKKDLDWENTNGVAREWWDGREEENKKDLATVYRLLENLKARKATIKEFFLAYVYSDADVSSDESIIANLERRRLEVESEPSSLMAQELIHGNLPEKIREAIKDLPDGDDGPAARNYFTSLEPSTPAEQSSLLLLLTEAIGKDYSLQDLHQFAKEKDKDAQWHDLLKLVAREKEKKKKPVEEKSNYDIGKELFDAGRYEDAVVALTIAIEESPTFAQAYFQRGYAKAEKARPEHKEAIKDYDKAIELDQADSSAYNNRGVSRHALGDKPAAAADFARAFNLSRKSAVTAKNLVSTLIELERYEQARAYLDEPDVAELLESKYRDLTYGFYAAVGRKESARLLADRAVKEGPGTSGPLNLRCWFYGRTNLQEPAFQDCLDAVKLAPEDGNILGSLAYARYKMGQGLDIAVEEFSKSVELLKRNGIAEFKVGEAYYFRGVIHDAIGNTPQAQSDYAQAVKLGYKITRADRELDIPRPDIIEKIKAQYPNSNLGKPTWGPPRTNKPAQ
jgi:tetratricopeptide (TPR) repeat protein